MYDSYYTTANPSASVCYITTTFSAQCHYISTKARMSSIFSLCNPPKAPRKDRTVRAPVMRSVRPLQLPPSPPPAPKKEKRTKDVDLTPIPFEWEHEAWVREANYLSGYVRPKLTNLKPEWILGMRDVRVLKDLKELYFPSSQPLNIYEEAFLSLMRNIIAFRIEQLSPSLV